MGLKAAGQWGPKGREGARMLLWSLVLFFPNSDPLQGGLPEDRESSQGRPLVGETDVFPNRRRSGFRGEISRSAQATVRKLEAALEGCAGLGLRLSCSLRGPKGAGMSRSR